MAHPIGIEDIEPDHFVACAFEAPGIFGSGKTRDEAVADVGARLGGPVRIAEEFRARMDVGDYIINAFFQDDLRPVSTEEIATARTLLDSTLADLIRQVKRRGDQRSMDIVDHVSRAEWWYFDRLDLASPVERLPKNPTRRLRSVHERTMALLPELVGTTEVVERSGERWSARKVLRRTLWHRQDHLRQLQAL